LLDNIAAEFPHCAAQRCFGAFLLTPPSGGLAPPTEHMLNQVRLLGAYRQLSEAHVDELAAEYKKAYPSVAQRAHAQKLSDRDAWAQHAGLGGVSPLAELIYIMLGFIVSETQCERDFARDVASLNTRRLKMGGARRFHCIKIMADGLPLDLLVKGSEPVGRLWTRAQNMYAKMHGTRKIVSMRPREDRGIKRTKPATRAGKDMVATFKRQRAKAMQDAVGGVPPTGMTIFNDNALDRTEVQRVRTELQAENNLFQTVIEKARKKLEKQKARYKAFSFRTPGALQ